MTNMYIRTWTPDDYDTLVGIANANMPEYASTVGDWQHDDEHRDPRTKWNRLVAELDGEVVGFGSYWQLPFMYHPQKFSANIHIHPAHQRRGIGTALYERLVAELQRFDALLLRGNIREDYGNSVGFATHLGFREEMREWESRLDIASFDLEAWAAQRQFAPGIAVKTLEELAHDPERNRKLHALETELDQDIPSPDEMTLVPFEVWEQRIIGNPGLMHDAFLVAVDGDEYVGVSALWRSQADQSVSNGLTGVRRSHRRKGIALALKLANLAYAKRHDIPSIKTWNASNNRAMLSINEALGFVKQPAWVNIVKTF